MPILWRVDDQGDINGFHPPYGGTGGQLMADKTSQSH